MLYELREFYGRDDLSSQAKTTLEICNFKRDFDSIYKYVSRQDTLDRNSILILKRGIFCGYDSSSLYGAGWSLEQETRFFELVLKKSPDQSIAVISIAVHYANNNLRDKAELFRLFFRAISMNFEHLHSIPDSWLDLFRRSDEYKYRIVDMEFEARSSTWNLYDYKEEVAYLDRKYSDDENLFAYVRDKLNEKIQALENI